LKNYASGLTYGHRVLAQPGVPVVGYGIALQASAAGSLTRQRRAPV